MPKEGNETGRNNRRKGDQNTGKRQKGEREKEVGLGVRDGDK